MLISRPKALLGACALVVLGAGGAIALMARSGAASSAPQEQSTMPPAERADHAALATLVSSRSDAPLPSDPAAILDALRNQPVIAAPPAGAPAETVARWRLTERALRRQRIDLITQLERARYAGPEMPRLLRSKIDDIAEELSATRAAHNELIALLQDMRGAHASSPLGALAERTALHETARLIGFDNRALSDADLERIAALEVATLDLVEPVWTGDALLDALRNRDDATKRAWRQWFVDNMPQASLARKAIERDMRIGSPMRLTGADFDGERIDTADWLGDVILVDFWGSWCAPCVAESPEIAAMAGEYAKQGFRVLGVAYDDATRAREFLASHADYDWPNIAPRPAAPTDASASRTINGYASPVADEFGVTSFPTYWLIDRAGRLRSEHNAIDIRSEIEALLREPRPGGAP